MDLGEAGFGRALSETIASLGSPVLIRMLGASPVPDAAIARWRHGSARVEIAPSDTIQLAMSLIDGQNARSRAGGFLADRVGCVEAASRSSRPRKESMFR
jgi:hypothetical protein